MAREFQLYGPAHLAALATIAGIAWALLHWFRRPDVPAASKMRARRLLAAALIAGAALDPLFALAHHLDDPATAWHQIVHATLPLHVCDIVSFFLAGALVTGSRQMAEPGYFWSLAFTIQGLITPALQTSWLTPEYYSFFVQHGGAPLAALILAFGVGMPPAKGYLPRMIAWNLGYLATIYLLNALIHTNYGFVNSKPPSPSLLDHLGPWPWYMLTANLISLVLYLALGEAAKWLNHRFPPPTAHQ